jgi:hypothetical protein
MTSMEDMDQFICVENTPRCGLWKPPLGLSLLSVPKVHNRLEVGYI